MKKLCIIILLISVSISCSFISKDNQSTTADQITTPEGYSGSWVANVLIPQYGNQSAAFSIGSSGNYGLSLISVYYTLKLKETASFESLLEAQLKSLDSQYQLGLITKADYEAKAQAYAAACDEKCAPIAAKYNPRLFNGFLQKDNNGYYVTIKGQKASVQFVANTIIIDDPIAGQTYIFGRY